MKLTFLGAAGTVTGSRYLVESGGERILVDCGLFQGYKALRLRNREAQPVDPATLSAVVLTHAHLDHAGALPLLVRDGFRGPIYCSAATRDLCHILLPDSGRLLEEEAAYANRHGYSKHAPALPLYTEADALDALEYLVPVDFHQRFTVGERFHVHLTRAGHILGAAGVTVDAEGRRLHFSGDLGRPNDPLLAPPEPATDADYIVVESTYGDKLHDPADPARLLGRTICETAARGGVTVIPSFAVGRAQALMHYLHRMKVHGDIPPVPIYLNSPMAADVTALYRKHRHDHRLTPEQVNAMCRAVTFVNTPAESIALNQRRVPMVIIAASGMATGGRVLHHIKAFAPDRRNTILFAGFQAGGTRGAALVDGAQEVKIHGEYVPVRARVVQIDNLSAHADQGELLAWLGACGKPRRVFVTHGEPEASDTLRRRIAETLGWSVDVPQHGAVVELG
ncbi:MBL fold metallo-hydrolase [Duganella sp. FT92W]|uniref:MBL fold metallo-hydrolase n=1 Tax=Pseudoduganella rivuli TaxID=2666085 RepID=A0A7X2IPM3_9BURK|nr:MBL fold metallo-hydrolase [Pseudoduganella rivuli]MRV73706.1 MBL fold metallo-hydrolase [Pseudoduganella rivuli]